MLNTTNTWRDDLAITAWVCCPACAGEGETYGPDYIDESGQLRTTAYVCETCGGGGLLRPWEV